MAGIRPRVRRQVARPHPWDGAKVTAHVRAGARRARLRPRRRARAVNRCAKLSSASRD